MAKKTKKEKKVASGAGERKLYMLECISLHKIRYVVETDEAGHKKIQKETEHGWNWGDAHDLTEFSQDHTGERCVTIWPITDKDMYLKMFDEDNDYLRSWSDEKKYEFINKK